MASRSKISNPEIAKAVAEAYVKGVGTDEMADLFGVHRDTIRVWCRDPRVQAHAGKIAHERVLRIVSRLDSKMEEIIEDIYEQDEPDPELILKIRKEYLSRTGTAEIAGVTPDQIGDTVKALEENPGLAEALKEMLDTPKTEQA